LKAWAVETTRFWEKERAKTTVFMAPKYLLRFYSRLRIKEDNGFEEILEQKIIYCKTGGHVLTLFFGKTGQRGIRRSSR
jgi:hypothetical protein